MIVLRRLPCLSSSSTNKMSIAERMKCNYSLNWPGLELCSRGYRTVAADLNLRLFCVGKTLPWLFLCDFISYAGFAQGLLRARFGCRCVHLKFCHVLIKLLWSSVRLTAWADTEAVRQTTYICLSRAFLKRAGFEVYSDFILLLQELGEEWRNQ